MLSLVQGRKKYRDAGQPIHHPIDGLKAQGTEIRRGQLTLIAAGPGCGKSAIVQVITQLGDRNGNTNPTLYFSADSDANTMYKRAAAIATGWEQDEAERLLTAGDTEGIDSTVAQATKHMRMLYESSPNEDMVLDNVEMFATVNGVYPEVVVMDNLKNLDSGGDGEFQALEQNCMFLHELARDTNAAVIVLHHVMGDYEDGLRPIPLSGLRGKVSKTPEVVLTMHRMGDQVLNVSTVKNRNGRADASGLWFFPISVDLGRMAFNG